MLACRFFLRCLLPVAFVGAAMSAHSLIGRVKARPVRAGRSPASPVAPALSRGVSSLLDWPGGMFCHPALFSCVKRCSAAARAGVRRMEASVGRLSRSVLAGCSRRGVR